MLSGLNYGILRIESEIFVIQKRDLIGILI